MGAIPDTQFSERTHSNTVRSIEVSDKVLTEY